MFRARCKRFSTSSLRSSRSGILRGGYFNNLGKLRSAGLIEYPQPDRVTLTEHGRALAAPPQALSQDQMQEALCRRVGPAKAAILRALIEVYPKALAKDALAERLGVSRTSGGYFNNLGALRTLGVIDYPAPGTVQALPVLFLEG
jgi:biotin operon repressor